MEIETAKKHGGWGAWRQLPGVEKAQLLAHELHKSMREHYEYDQLRPAPAAAESPRPSPLTAMRERFFGGGKNLHA